MEVSAGGCGVAMWLGDDGGQAVSPTEQAPRCRLELPGAPRGGKGRKGMGLGLRWTPEVTLELWEDSTHLLPCPTVDLGGCEGQRLGSEAGWDEDHTYTCGRRRPGAIWGFLHPTSSGASSVPFSPPGHYHVDVARPWSVSQTKLSPSPVLWESTWFR